MRQNEPHASLLSRARSPRAEPAHRALAHARRPEHSCSLVLLRILLVVLLRLGLILAALGRLVEAVLLGESGHALERAPALQIAVLVLLLLLLHLLLHLLFQQVLLLLALHVLRVPLLLHALVALLLRHFALMLQVLKLGFEHGFHPAVFAAHLLVLSVPILVLQVILQLLLS